jgi:hypothetical protein
MHRIDKDRASIPSATNVPKKRSSGVADAAAHWMIVKLRTLVVPFRTADIVATVVVVTGAVWTVNVAVVAPPVIVTLAGTEAADKLEESAILSPPAGAALVIVTVPVEFNPPTTEAGFTMTDSKSGARTVNDPEWLAPFREAEILTTVFAPTADVATAKVPDFAPPGTVIVAATEALEELDPRLMVSPLDGATLPRLTVPVAPVPPTTDAGFSTTELIDGAFTAKPHVRGVPLNLAEIVALLSAATAEVLTMKVLEIAPASTVTLAGTITKDESEVRGIGRPPAGALDPSVMVPVARELPTTVDGVTLTQDSIGGSTSSVRDPLKPLDVAVTVADSAAATGTVVSAKVAELCPARTMKADGTRTKVEFETNATASPPTGAGPLIVTLPVESKPPRTVDGSMFIDFIEGGSTARVAVALPPLYVAVIVTTVNADTGSVLTSKVEVVPPDEIATSAGTITHGELLERTILAPAIGAGKTRDTVADSAKPPRMEPCEIVNSFGSAGISQRVPS